MTARRYYPGITLFKVCGAVLVVFAHVAPLWTYGGGSGMQLFRYAGPLSFVVPCFYIISGFLVSQGWMRKKNPLAYVKSYITRIGAVYLALLVFYVAKDVIPGLITSGASSGSILEALKRIVVDAVLGPEAFLWFIPPLLVGLAITYWLVEKRLFRRSLPLLSVGFLICLCINGTLRLGLELIPGFTGVLSARGVHYLISVLTNYVGYGLTFVALGVLIAQNESRFLKIGVARLATLCVVLTAGECVLVKYGTLWGNTVPLCLCLVPSSLLLFRGILRWQGRGAWEHHEFWNVFSGVAYFGHHPIYEAYQLITGASEQPGTLESVLVFVGVLGACFACTLIVVYWLGRRAGPVVEDGRSIGWRADRPA